jgi:hypothetical protein
MRPLPLFSAFALVAAGAAVAVWAGAPAPQIAALAQVEPGQWQIKPFLGDGPARSLCISNAASFIQIEHGEASCSRFVVEDRPGVATVSYSCPGAGSGRTTIRVETTRLLDIQSQGIVNNAPFEVRYEARRTGPCAAAAR